MQHIDKMKKLSDSILYSAGMKPIHAKKKPDPPTAIELKIMILTFSLTILEEKIV